MSSVFLCDVAVVGVGSAGATCAGSLARQGVRVGHGVARKLAR